LEGENFGEFGIYKLPIFFNATKYFSEITMAGLLKYFKPKKKRGEDNDNEENLMSLQDPNGDLSKVVLSSSIEVTNMVVCQALEKERGSRGPYIRQRRSMLLVKELLKMELL